MAGHAMSAEVERIALAVLILVLGIVFGGLTALGVLALMLTI